MSVNVYLLAQLGMVKSGMDKQINVIIPVRLLMLNRIMYMETLNYELLRWPCYHALGMNRSAVFT